MKYINVKNQQEAFEHLSSEEKLGLKPIENICFINEDNNHFFYYVDLECDILIINITDSKLEEFDISTIGYAHISLSTSNLHDISDRVETICEKIEEDVEIV